MNNHKKIIFSYLQLSNVGCEIILRGTVAFLHRAYAEYDLQFVIASYDPVRDRKILEDLKNIEVVPMIGWKRYIRGMLVKTGFDKRFWTPRFASRHFRNADLFVSVGGDIYTMNGNKLPSDWLGWERFATRHGIPSIMFGANMEKFEMLSALERSELVTHLKHFKLIFVRDLVTLDYLATHEVSENTAFSPDPIFSLRPSCQFNIKKVNTIGLNLSPIILSDFGHAAFERMAGIIEGLTGMGYKIRLIPHVYASDGNPSLDDRNALRLFYDQLSESTQAQVSIYSDPMSFADIAREIAKVDLFIGARMHSCLNAVTMGKPTYFLAYSSKASTMVSWLRDGPLADLPNVIECSSAKDVTLDALIAFIASFERRRASDTYEVNFGTKERDRQILQELK